MNDEPKYETYMHLISPSLVKTLTVKGKIDVSYVGFGPKGKNRDLSIKLINGNCQHDTH